MAPGGGRASRRASRTTRARAGWTSCARPASPRSRRCASTCPAPPTACSSWPRAGTSCSARTASSCSSCSPRTSRAACARPRRCARSRERAAQDPLTGLGHHAAFYEALAASHRRPRTAVLLCDLDGFKGLNDRFGHQHGDQVLRDVAAALGGALRRGDRLFRIGGDEFAALLAVAGDDEALEAGERLRAAVAAAGLGLTVSIGVAVPARRRGRHGASWAAPTARSTASRADGRDGVALA